MSRIALRVGGRAASVLCVFALAGCSNTNDMVELQDYVQSVVNRPPGAIEPLPMPTVYESFTYSAAGLRSPFDMPVLITTSVQSQRSGVAPDETRPKEYLENFALGALNMVGSLAKNRQRWALIKDETGKVTRVAAGEYMGRNYGRIVNITPRQIDLVEIVPTGDGGWIERPQTVLLQE